MEPLILNFWYGPFIPEPLLSDLNILTFDTYTLNWDLDYLNLQYLPGHFVLLVVE